MSVEIRCLIRRMAAENPTWGEERTLTNSGSSCKFGSRHVRSGSIVKQLPVIACDFFVSVNADFRLLYTASQTNSGP